MVFLLLIPPLEKGGKGGFENTWKYAANSMGIFMIYKISPNPSLPKRGKNGIYYKMFIVGRI